MDDSRSWSTAETRRSCWAAKGGLSLALLLAVVPAASGAGFDAVVIAQSGDASGTFSFNDFGFFVPGQSPAPSINASGEVAFWGALSDGLNEAIYKGAGGPLTTVADTTGSDFFEFGRIPAINAIGEVAFGGEGAIGAAVFRGDGATTTTVLAAGAGSSDYAAFGDPSLNANSRLAFFAQGPVAVALLTKHGNLPDVAASTAGAKFNDFPGFPIFGVPSLNDVGRVAFYAFTDAGYPGIFETAATGGAIANTLAVTGLDLKDFRDPAMNNSGRVAFWASTDLGERIVFAQNGALHTVADTSVAGSFEFDMLGDPALNADGAIAFWAMLTDGSQAVFLVDPAGEISRVLGTGDALLGSTIEEMGLGNKGLNPQGDMAIWAMLADDSEVILRTVDVCPLDPRHDIDGDGVCGNIDNCPKISNSAQADIDRDGVGDACDNCTLIPNGPAALDAGGASQRDGDGDGYGNACDADFDQNNVVNFGDLAAMKKVFFKTNLVADLNGDGVVNFSDLAILKKAFFKPPGPAAGRP